MNNNTSSSSSSPPLPKGWTKAYSKSQKRYFWSHIATKTSQWHPPTPDEIDNPQQAKRIADEKAKAEREEIRKKKEAAAGGGKKRKGKDGKGGSSMKEKRKKFDSAAVVDSEDEENLKGFSLAETTNVAIIVPFRDLHPEQNRQEHLNKFLPHMNEFLRKLKVKNLIDDYHVYIVEQSDDGRKFNRGKLLNIGFDYAKRARPHDVFIFHDVDLLPGDDLGSWYARFPRRPIHIARCWDRYSNNPKYFGGIVSFSASDMRRINGCE